MLDDITRSADNSTELERAGFCYLFRAVFGESTCQRQLVDTNQFKPSNCVPVADILIEKQSKRYSVDVRCVAVYTKVDLYSDG